MQEKAAEIRSCENQVFSVAFSKFFIVKNVVLVIAAQEDTVRNKLADHSKKVAVTGSGCIRK